MNILSNKEKVVSIHHPIHLRRSTAVYNQDGRLAEGISVSSVVFLGHYGYRNTGDDVFCVVGAWGAKKYWGLERVGFWAQPSELPVMPVPYEVLKPDRIFLGNSKLLRGYRVLRGVSRLFGSVLVFAGGSTFTSGPKKGTVGWFGEKLARLGLVRMGAIGVSLGPFRTKHDYETCRKFLASFCFVVLRDRKSFDIANEMALPRKPILGFDLAALLPKVYGQPSSRLTNSGRPILGISVCHYERYEGEDISRERSREQKVLDMLKHLARSVPVHLRFFIFNSNPNMGDEELTRQMAKSLSSKATINVVSYDPNPGNTWKRVAECNAFFSIRLHGGIFAAVAGIPFLMIEYHRKCKDFIDDLGSDSANRIGDFEVSPVRVANRLAGLLTNKVTQRNFLSSEIVKRAEVNFTEPLKMLNGETYPP